MLAALLTVLSALLGCGKDSSPAAPSAPADDAPAEFIPQHGLEPNSTEPRIVALSPALAVTLRDLGYAPLIVGRHAHDLILPKALLSCGELGTIDYEALLRVRPTHIFIQWGSQELPPRLIELGQRQNWIIRSYNPLTLDDVLRSAADMDMVLQRYRGRGQPAAPESSITPSTLPQRADVSWQKVPWGAERAGKILLLGGIDPPSALGPGSFHHQLLQRLGGWNAVDSGSPWIRLDLDDIIHLNPDGIILFTPAPPNAERDPRSPEDIKAAFGRLGTLPITAVQSGRLAIIDHPLAMLPATSLFDVADDLKQVLQQWAWPQGLPAQFRPPPIVKLPRTAAEDDVDEPERRVAPVPAAPDETESP